MAYVLNKIHSRPISMMCVNTFGQIECKLLFKVHFLQNRPVKITYRSVFNQRFCVILVEMVIACSNSLNAGFRVLLWKLDSLDMIDTPVKTPWTRGQVYFTLIILNRFIPPKLWGKTTKTSLITADPIHPHQPAGGHQVRPLMRMIMT